MRHLDVNGNFLIVTIENQQLHKSQLKRHRINFAFGRYGTAWRALAWHGYHSRLPFANAAGIAIDRSF